MNGYELETLEAYSEFEDEAFEPGSEASRVYRDRKLGRVFSVPRAAQDRETEAIRYRDAKLGYVWSVPRSTAAGELGELEREAVGPENLKPVLNTLGVPYRWICRLELNFGPDPREPSNDLHRIGTGTLISPRHVLTAAHNLYNDFHLEGYPKVFVRKVKQVRVTPGYNCSGRVAAPLGWSYESRWDTHPNWDPRPSKKKTRSQRDQEDIFEMQFDYGLIKLKRALGSRSRKALGGRPLGYWGSRTHGEHTRLTPKDPNFLRGLAINISGYAGEKCCLKEYDSSKGCRRGSYAGAQFRSFANVTNSAPSAAPRLIFYSLDTRGGHSGSPVWLRWKQYRNLIAIHTGPAWPIDASLRGKANRGVRITDEVVRQIQAWM